MNAQEYYLNIRPGDAFPQTVKMSQEDVGRPLKFYLMDGSAPLTIATGTTITIHGTKPSGLGFSESCTWAGNAATISTTLGMTQEAGMFPVELVLTKSSDVIATANCMFVVERSPHPTGTTDGTKEELDDLYAEVAQLKEEISELDGLSDDVKQALLQIASKVAYIDDDGQDYYDALEAALYPQATLVSISAEYTQSGTVLSTDSINDLRNDLVVTALYDDSSTAVVTTYTLNGTLTEGTQTITVSYNGKTTTFTVNVTANGWLYHFDQSLASSGSEEFTFTGTGVYSAGRLGTDYAYSHIVPTSGDATSDTQMGLKATGLAKTPDFGKDFTLSFWMATQVNKYCHPYSQVVYTGSTGLQNYFDSSQSHKTGWSVESSNGNSAQYSGFLIQGSSSSGKLIFRFANSELTKGAQFAIVFPSSVDTTQWHHYALTRKDNTVRFFFDGELIGSATTSETTVYNAGQVAVSTMFYATSADKNNIQTTPNGEKMQDLYITEFCKWVDSFEPSAITY